MGFVLPHEVIMRYVRLDSDKNASLFTGKHFAPIEVGYRACVSVLLSCVQLRSCISHS